MAKAVELASPQRWSESFDPEMSDDDVAWLMGRPEIAAIEADRFPARIPLSGILKHDTRIVRSQPGDLIVREGDYGNSAFLILEGELRVVLAPGLPRAMLGRYSPRKRGLFGALAQLATNRKVPEVRDISRYRQENRRRVDRMGRTRVFLDDVPAVLEAHKTASLGTGRIFGELAALGRTPRTATVFAEDEATLLEIRWQGLRELRRFDPGWRRQIDENYRATALATHLREVALFENLDDAALEKIASATLFETYGSFDWSAGYQRAVKSSDPLTVEPVIAKEGDYPDGLLMIRAGFARVSQRIGNGERTLTYLRAGDLHGDFELYTMWRENRDMSLNTSVRAIGYVDLLRVPGRVLDEFVFSELAKPPEDITRFASRPLSEDSLLEWAVERRMINGTRAMLIDLDKCVRCDDCVRACASTHGGNPRFVRHGQQTDHWMVANACMHCVDPVCLIGCPTGAIHRSAAGGTVVVNDDTCIGCGTCANSCPYDNIRLVQIADKRGRTVINEETGRPVLKATKCDLCQDQIGGPACQRACPHDALRRVGF